MKVNIGLDKTSILLRISRKIGKARLGELELVPETSIPR
jgi:hypothetical protein